MLQNRIPGLLSSLLPLILLLAVATSSCTDGEPGPVTPNDTAALVATTRQDSTANDTIDRAENPRFGRFDGEIALDGTCVWVDPYYKADGTCVRGHWRSAPGTSCAWVGTTYKGCD